ncbi:MAG: GIY-YIG nuclease family protein [Bacteroidota bacterium]
MAFHSYVLRSRKDGRFYYGSTSALSSRIIAHNCGRVRSTKGRRPWVVWFFEEFQTKREARQRESFYKSIDGYHWLKDKGIIP